ncbi:hypothetical protein FQR65_LT15311 [Abscondita terminalis]|nr:hypothetical protein FQR65_LT15311 [Abscondita terminalis]
MFVKHLISSKFRRAITFLRYQSTAYLSENKEDLIIKIKDRNEHFPLVWLRDNCRCESCFHHNSNSRIIDWSTFDTSPTVKNIEVVANDVIVKWQDNHTSTFDAKWLGKRSFLKESQNNYLENKYRVKKILWYKNGITSLTNEFDYHDVMNNKSTLYKWLIDLARYGVSFVQNVPNDKTACRKVANRIAFIRKTHYEDEFDIISKPTTSNVAYLNGNLQLHTDLPYYEYTPGVTLLHCLVQTEATGGESLLTDGFHVVEKLRKENKETFDILSSVNVNWVDVGAEHGDKYHTIYRSPVIKLDSEGKVEKVLHSVPQRDSHFTVDKDLVIKWYKAMKIFVDQINLNAFKFKLTSGTLMAFDNTRLLHGRVGYQDLGNNQRHLIGCYLDWDEIFSRIRVLSEE